MPRRPAPKLLALLLVLLAAACVRSPMPDPVPSATTHSTAFPALIPLGPLLAQANAQNGAAQSDPTAGLGGRITRLNARAAALRGGVIDPQTRAQMQAGVDTSALQ